MARDFASVNVEIWSDPEWRTLPPAAQHLYLLLWTSPGLSYCGVHDWRPGRLAALSRGFTAEHIDTVAATLSARHFLVIDEDTEEVLIRSWARFDGLMKKPRMAVSYANAYAAVASADLRSVMAHETAKLREMLPELSCWGDPRVAAILSHPAVSAKDLPTPSDPFADGFATAFTQGLPQTAGDVCQGTYLPPTPAPTPTPSTSTPRAPRDKRGVRIPDDFAVSDEMREWAKEKGFGSLDLDGITEEFVDFWKGVAGSKGVKLDWPGTWRNWIRRKATDTRPRLLALPAEDAPRLPTAAELVAARNWGEPCAECERQGGQHFRGCSRYGA